MSSRDSIGKTFVVAGTLCVVCSVLVSSAAVALRPTQERQKVVDRQKNILLAAGLYDGEGDVTELYEQYIEARAIDLDTGEYVGTDVVDPETYDQKKASKDPELSESIPGDQDVAVLKRREHHSLVYLVKEGGAVTQYVLPVRGYGLWSTLWGFLALDADGETVRGLSFYEHAETPGLGGEVDNPRWKALWPDKKLFDDSGELALRLIKGQVDPTAAGAEHRVDGLAGATITANGVNNMLEYWFGESGYLPFLARIRSGS